MFKKSINFLKNLFTKNLVFYNHPSVMQDSPLWDYMNPLLNKNTIAEEVHLTIAQQARAIYSSVGVVQGCIETLKSEILGEKGLLIDLHTGNHELDDTVEKRFALWAKNVGHNKTFYKIQHEIMHKYYVDGEVFVVLRDIDNVLVLTILDTFRLSHYCDEKKKIWYGIQYDEFDTPEYYYFTKNEPQPENIYDPANTIKIEANAVIHFKNGDYRRGISFLAGCIDMSYDSLNLVKEEIRRGLISSQFVGFMKTPAGVSCYPMGTEEISSGFGVGKNGTIRKTEKKEDPKGYGITPGTLPVLPAGMEPVFTSPAEPPRIVDFLNCYFYHLGGALGLTYPTVTGDLSEVNYSSIRAGSLKERRLFGVKQTFLIEEVLSPIFETWVNHPSNYGNNKLDLVREKILLNYSFKTPTWQHVDPVKEANSAKIQLEQGIVTLQRFSKTKVKT